MAKLFQDNAFEAAMVTRSQLAALTETTFVQQAIERARASRVPNHLRIPFEDPEAAAIAASGQFLTIKESELYFQGVRDLKKVFFKTYRPGTPPDLIQAGNYNECVSAVLVREVGVLTPSTRAGAVAGLTNKNTGMPIAKSDGLLGRFIEGKEVLDASLPELIALKDELAKVRALNLWLGNPDGHLGNVKICNGHLVTFDFGSARLNRSLEAQPLKGLAEKGFARDREEFLDWVLTYINERGSRDDAHKAYRWAHSIDDLLSWSDMEGTVMRMEALCRNPDRLKAVIREGYRLSLPSGGAVLEPRIEITATELIQRLPIVRRLLKEKFTPKPVAPNLPRSSSHLRPGPGIRGKVRLAA